MATTHSSVTVPTAQWGKSCYYPFSKEEIDMLQLQDWVKRRQLLHSSHWTQLSCASSWTSQLPSSWEWGLQASLLLCSMYWRHGSKHIVCDVNIVFQNARYMRGTICCSEVICSCHMPPYCCYGCFHGKSSDRPRKEPAFKSKSMASKNNGEK